MTTSRAFCTRDGCDRSFKNDRGLAIHLAAHDRHDNDSDEDAALKQATRQPVEGDTDDTEDEETEDVERHLVEGGVELDDDEFELLLAYAFLHELAGDEELLCAAVSCLLETCREDPMVKKAIDLKRKVGEE